MQFLNQGPSSQALSQLAGPLMSLIGDNGMGAFNQFMAAAQPGFERNLNFGLGALNAAAPAANSSAFGLQGIDTTTRALDDFNMFSQQARLGFLQPSLQAAGLLTSAAGAAGQENIGMAINPTSNIMNTIFGGGFQPGLGEAVQTGGPLDFITQGILGASALIPGIGQIAPLLAGLFSGGGNPGSGNIPFQGGNMFGGGGGATGPQGGSGGGK